MGIVLYVFLFCALVITPMILVLPAYATGEYWLDDDSFKKRIMISIYDFNVIGSSHTDFPALIYTKDHAELHDSNVKSDGRDIRFTASDGKTPLSYEIQKFTNDFNYGTMSVFVKIPVLSGTSTTFIYMYYNSDTAVDAQSPSSVWSNGYTGVYHLNEILSGNKVEDSSPYASHGTIKGSGLPKISSNGKLFKGMYFEKGINIQLPDKPELHIGNSDFTVSGLMRFDPNMTGDPAIIGDQNWNNGDNTGFVLVHEDKKIGLNVGFNDDSSARTEIYSSKKIPDLSWRYVAAVIDKDRDMKLYVDYDTVSAQLKNNFKNGNITLSNNMHLASDGTGSYKNHFMGFIDEIRFSNVARSDGWVKTMVKNFGPAMFSVFDFVHEINLSPIITLNGVNLQRINLGTAYNELGATATTRDGVDISAHITIDITTVDTNTLGVYDVIYDVKKSGRAATVKRIVEVVEDNTPPSAPVITDPISGAITAISNANISVTGEPGADITVLIDSTSYGPYTVDLSGNLIISPVILVEGPNVITATQEDPSGNTSLPSIPVTITLDTIPPVITLNPPSLQIIELGAGYTEIGARTDDGSAVRIDKSNFRDKIGFYPVIYSSTDGAGNEAQREIRTVEVKDRTNPTITAPDDMIVPNDVGLSTASGIWLGNVVADDHSGIVISQDIREPFPVGQTVITYTATDDAGNSSTDTQIITVIDRELPVITLQGITPISIEWNSVYVDAGATAIDNAMGDITGQIDIVNPVNTRIGGTYTVTYDVQDTAGNNAVQVTRTVNVENPPPEPKVVKRGGGSSGDKISPSISVSFDEHEYPLEYAGVKYNHNTVDTIPTKTIKVGEKLNVTLRVYENSGPSNVWHAEMYLNHHGIRVLNNLSETVIIHDKQKGFEIIDPHNIIDTADIVSSIHGNKAVFEFSVTLKEGIPQSDILFRVWDIKRNSMTLHLPDVLTAEMAQKVAPELPKNMTNPTPETGKPAAPKVDTSSDYTDVQLLTLKGWAGYDVIIFSDADVLSAFDIKGDKIPPYVKDTVNWILKDKINKEEFVNMLQYLQSIK